MNAAARLVLGVLALVAFGQWRAGTLNTWARAKFLGLPPTSGGAATVHPFDRRQER